MTQEARPFALVVRFTVRSGCEASFDQLVARTAAGIRAHEPGTLIYACHAVDGVPRQWIFYELYRDRAAFADHEAQPHTRQFLAERAALLEATAVDFLDLADGKLPVAPSTLRSRSGSTGTPGERGLPHRESRGRPRPEPGPAAVFPSRAGH